MTNMTRSQRRGSNKKKYIILSLIFVPLLLIAAVFTYGYLQYKSAFENSKDDSILDDEPIEFNPVEVTEEKYNVLMLGIDARGEEQSRTDTIMIAQYDEKTKDTKLVSIMRDTYVEIPGHDSNKINAAHAIGGVELLRKTIEHNFGVDLHYYAIVDFQSFSKVVDVAFPDGVEIDVEKDMSKGIDHALTAGKQTLNGAELLDYVRFRQDSESDFGRVRRQQEVLKVLSNEFSELNTVVKLPKIMGTAMPYIKTNMENSLLIKIGPSVLFENKSEMESLRIPMDGTFTDERYDHAGLVLATDIETNKTAIQEFLGE